MLEVAGVGWDYLRETWLWLRRESISLNDYLEQFPGDLRHERVHRTVIMAIRCSLKIISIETGLDCGIRKGDWPFLL